MIFSDGPNVPKRFKAAGFEPALPESGQPWPEPAGYDGQRPTAAATDGTKLPAKLSAPNGIRGSNATGRVQPATVA